MPLTTIRQLVRNRLTFLKDSDVPVIDTYILEAFALTQVCLGKEEPENPEQWNEEDYSLLERSFIADLVSYFMLIKKSIDQTSGSDTSVSDGNATIPTFLKKAKAGSAEVEFDSAYKNFSGFATDMKATAQLILDNGRTRAAQLGCTGLYLLFPEVIEFPVVPFKFSGNSCC